VHKRVLLYFPLAINSYLSISIFFDSTVQGDGDSIARFYIKVRVLPATITCHQPYGTTFQTLRFMANETACFSRQPQSRVILRSTG
jgi:hypothetical protein